MLSNALCTTPWVTTCVVVWIEIIIGTGYDGQEVGHHLRGGVD